MRKILALAILFVACSQVSFAGKIYVRKTNNTADSTPSALTYSTIQAALAAIPNGDTLIIYDGTYPEKINFNQSGSIKRIVIGSRYLINGDKSHISKTIIDAADISQSNEWADAIIAAYDYRANRNDAQIIGITLTGAKRFGLYMAGGTIRACIFKDNGLGYGYTFMRIANTLIDSCTFDGNKSYNLVEATDFSGASNKKTIIRNSVFKNNLQSTNTDGALVSQVWAQDLLVQNSLFYKNKNGHIFSFGGNGAESGVNISNNDSIFVSNSLIYDNESTVANFRTWERRDGGTFYFLNNIINKNTDYFRFRGGDNTYSFGFFNNYIPLDMTRSKQSDLSASAIYTAKNNYESTNKILFKDTANGDYRLADSSFGFALGLDTLAIDTFNVVHKKDFDGNVRPNPSGTKIDLGPFENVNAVSIPILTKATAGNSKVYLNWKLYQNTYDSILVYRSTDSSSNSYEKIGAAVKQTTTAVSAGQINNESNYIDLGTFGTSRYYLSKTRRTWTNSRSTALTDGADLVTFESKSEYDFVMNEAKKTTGETIWIGLYQKDKTNEPRGNWVWVNGMDMSAGYTLNFGNNYGEPNNAGGNEDWCEARWDYMNDGGNGDRFYLIEIDRSGDNGTVDFTDTTAVNNTKYFYKLKAKINSGDVLSGFSNIKSARPSAGYPLPNNISLMNASRLVKVKWTNPTTEKKGTGSYKIFSGTDSSAVKLVATVSDKDSSYIDSNKVAGKTYYYKLKAVDTDGVESDFTKAFSVKVTSYVYIASNGTEKGFGSESDPVQTFNQAMVVAADADTVVFSNGTFSFAESQRISKVITIASKYIATKDTNDINNTIITSGNGIGTVFSGNNLSKSFIGLTFQNNPGGVFAMDNVTVENCRFVQNGTFNTRTSRFIGVYNNSKIIKSKFLNNYGTIELNGNDVNINQNYFEGNIFGNRTNTQVSWLLSGWVGKVKIENNIFIKNGEYVKQTWGNENETAVIGIDGWQDTSFVSNNTFINNDAAAILFNQRNRSAVVVNNLFYKNKTDLSFLKYESYNNNQFIYSNISNNIISQPLNSYPNISSYAYSSHSGNNLVNPEYGFKDELSYRIGNSSAAIGAGVKTIVRNSNTIFTGPANDYYDNARSNTKMDIGAEQTAQQFPAPGLKGDAGDTKATLTWNKSNSTIAGYNIFKSSSPIPDNATSAYVTINNPDSLILPETSLTNLSRYYYRIQAFDNANNKSGLSNEVLIRPNTVPSKLSGITAAAGARSATIEWARKSSIYGYTIFRGTKQDSLIAITGSIDSTYFVDRDLKANSNYYYGVRVTDSVGVKSEMSNVVLVTPSNLHYVDTSSKTIQNGSKQYPYTNLSDAVANTSNGDTVIIKKGRLNISETVRYSKSITIASEWIITNEKNDISSTIITSENDIGSLFQKVNSNNFNPRLNLSGISFKQNKSQLFNLDQLTISNCIFEENGDISNRKRWFVAFQWTDTIQNSTFINNNGYITLGGGDIVFRNNKFINNSYGASDDPYPLINGWTGKVKFESNYFIGNGIYSQRPWDNLKTDVIRLEGWQDTVIVANNTFINNDAVAIQFLPNQKHAIVVNNLFYGNKADFNFTNPGNNPAFLYSNISNNFINTSLEKYQYITSYNYRSNSANNVLNGINAFVDTIDYKLSPISGAIGLGSKIFRTNNMQVYTAQGTDYFGNAITDKVDIGAHQTTFAFPAPSLNEVEGGNAKIKVSWLKSSKLIKGYNVYRSESPIAENSNPTPFVTIDKPDSLFIINTGTNGTKYYYRVKAYDSSSTAKFSGFSNELSVTPNIPPAKAEVFTGEAGPRINYLNWNKKDTTYKFNLYRGVSRDSLIVIARGLDSVYYVDKNLEVNKEYFYAIKVTDKGGAASEISDILSLKTTNIYFVDTLIKSSIMLGTSKKPYLNIQDAIDASLDSDTILVKPGIYSPFRISNKGITVRSTDGPIKTFINSSNQSDYYLVRVDGNDNDSRPYKSIQVEGFTIAGMKNWRGGDWGAAISVVRNTSPIFKNNIVRDIENYNTISIDQSAPTFLNNLFVNNRGNFLNVGWNIDSTSAQYKMPRFINCTFTKTRGWGNNGVNAKGIIPFINSIFWNNDPSTQITASYYSIRNSLVEYQSFDKKNGNIRIDPLFINEEQGDFRLSNSSPALGKGVSSLVVGGQTLLSGITDIVRNQRPGPDATRPDLGAYENPNYFPAPTLKRLQKSGSVVKLTFSYDKSLDVSKLILYKDSIALKLDTLSLAVKDVSKDTIIVLDTLKDSKIYNYALRSVVNNVKSGISNILSTNDTTYVPDVAFESDTATFRLKTIESGTVSFVNLNGTDYNYPSIIMYDNRWKSGDRSNKSPNDSIYFIRTTKSDRANQSVKFSFNKRMHLTLGGTGDLMQVLGPINLNYDDEFDMAAVVQKSGKQPSAGNLLYENDNFKLQTEGLPLRFNRNGYAIDTAVIPAFSFKSEEFPYNSWARNNQSNVKDALDMIDGNFDGTQEHIVSISQLKWVPKFNSPSSNCSECINSGMRIVKFIDINNDGLKDIVAMTGDNWQVGYPNTGGVSIHLFVSNKVLGQYEMYRTGLFMDWNSILAVEDYNKDGRADILCRSINQTNYSIYELNNDYSYKESAKTLAIASEDSKIVSDDINNDGYPDVVTLSTNGFFNVYLNDQKNGFTAKRFIVPFNNSNQNNIWSAYRFSLVDMNGDGFKDLFWVENIWNGIQNEQVFKTVIQSAGEQVLSSSATASTASVTASNDGYNVKVKWSGFTGNNGNKFQYNVKVDTIATYATALINTGFNYKKSNPQIPIVLDQITSSKYQDSIVYRDPNISSKYPYSIAVQAVSQSGKASDYKEISYKPKDPLSAQASTLPGMTNARFAWGDYNNDGQLDLAVIGLGDENIGQVLRIYKNDKGNLVDLQLTNKQLKEGDVKWVDIDKDGWLDLVATGQSGSVPTTVLFKNNEGIFDISYPTTIPALKNSRMTLGDYDNNGTIDMIITGQDAIGEPRSYLLNNDGRGNFSKVDDFNSRGVMPNIYNAEMRLIDYDLDGDLDLVYTGVNKQGNAEGGIRLSSLLDEQSTRFNQFYGYGLNLKNARFDLGDIDSDGDLDIIVMGTFMDNTLEKPITKIIKNFSADSKVQGNYNNQFIYNNYQEIVIDSLDNGDVKFADVNNDGLLDISISGLDNKKTPTTRIYINQGGFGNYSLLKTLDLPQFRNSAISWGDYNNDGNMDMVITGTKAIGTETVIYVNDQGSNKNVAPNIPNGLTVSDLGQGKIILKWKAPTDDHTPSRSLSYMIRLGTKPGAGDLSTLPIDTAGRLQTPTFPVIGTNEFYTELPPGRYYWSVMAIDGNFKNSKFSEEQSFILKYPWKYINQGGLVDRRISPIDNSQFAWADFNNDGLTDFIYLGNSGVWGQSPAGIYRNNSGAFLKVESTNGNGFSGLNGIDNVKNLSIKCKDINNDGFVDLFVAGEYNDNNPFFRAFVNKRGFAFQDVSFLFNITNILRDPSLDFSDLDNNGTPDMIYSGTDNRGVGQVLFFTTKLDTAVVQGAANPNGFTISTYETNIKKVLNDEEAQNINLAFTDFNQDKRVDMVMLYDNASGQRKAEVFNGGLDEFGKGTFTKNNDVSLPKVKNSTLDVVDFNKDGYPDIALSGYSSANGQMFKIYQNKFDKQTGRYTFTNTSNDLLLPIQDGKTTWGDFNMDGYPDVIFSGTRTGAGYVTKMATSALANNNVVRYTELPVFPFGDYLQLTPTMGDIMGDGQLGAVLVGRETIAGGSVINAFKLLQNVRGLSSKIEGKNGIVQGKNSVPFTPISSAYNKTSGAKNKLKPSFDLQGAAFKIIESLTQQAQENDNQRFVENQPPDAPTDLKAAILERVANLNLVKLSWNPGKDDLTPNSGLTFSLRVGKKPGKSDVIDAESNRDGARKTPTNGNTENNTQWDIQLPNGTYYWSVQAVDASFAGSDFAKESTLIIQNDAIVAGSAPSDIFLNGSSKDTVYLAQDQLFSTVKYKLTTYSVDSAKVTKYNYSLYDDDDFVNPRIFAIDTSLNNLYLNGAYQKDSTYNVRVRVTDSRGLAYDKQIAFVVVAAPTNLLLDGATTSFVNYASAKDAEQLSVTMTGVDDRISSDKLTYTFVEGIGSENNSMFGIKNSNILYNKVALKLADTLRVRVAVSNGFASLEKAIRIYAGCDFTSVKFTDSKSEVYKICEGDVVNLTLAKTAVTVNLFKDDALISTASNTNKVSLGAPGKYYAIYNVDGTGTCGNKTDSVFVEYSVPVTNITYTGALTICSNTEKQLVATAATGYKYQWFRNDQALNGSTGSIINAKDAGKYKVKITNSQNCSATSKEVVLNVIQAADVTLSQKTDTTICEGTTLQIKVADGPNSYQWFRNGNPDQGNSSIYNFSGNGQVSVRITSSNGCIATSDTRNITTTANPIAPVLTQTATALCQGQSVVIMGQVIGGVTYQWLKDGAKINGASEVNYSATSTGNYQLQLTNQFGCTSRSASAAITSKPIPAAPTVSRDASDLVSSSTQGNQWYNNLGEAIPGATSQKYRPTTNGYYTVRSTVNGCTSLSSANYFYVSTAVLNLSNGQFVRIFPNPIVNDMIIEYNIQGQYELNIQLYDMTGKLVLERKGLRTGQLTNLTTLSKGTYMLKVLKKDGKVLYSGKIAKQ